MNILRSIASNKHPIRTLLGCFCAFGLFVLIVALAFLNLSKATYTAVDFIKNDPEIIAEYGNYQHRSPIITGEISHSSSLDDGYANINFSFKTDIGKYYIQIRLIKSDYSWTVTDYSISQR